MYKFHVIRFRFSIMFFESNTFGKLGDFKFTLFVNLDLNVKIYRE